MKESPIDKKLRNRLGASKFSGEGFLGNDKRDLDGIIHDDLQILDENGIEKQTLVKLLQKAYDKVRNGLGTKVKLCDGVYGEFYESMGRVPSPFRGDGVFEKGEAVVIDEASNEKLIITSLAINLIQKHDFFQGKGSRYRIEPLTAYKILKKMIE